MSYRPQAHDSRRFPDRDYAREGLHAPYNFVPLSRWIYLPDWADQVSHDIPFEDGICGHLDISITAHSPILVGQEQDRDRPLRFHRLPDGTPAIPGSSLRGLIRNVIEIAAFGKLRYFDNQRFGVRDLTNGAIPFYRQYLTRDRGNQTYEPLSKAGWLRFTDGQWQLIPCEHARVEHHELRTHLGKDWVKISKQDRPSALDKYTAWLKHGGSLAITFNAGPARDQQHSGKRLHYRKAENLGKGGEHGMLVFTGQPGPNKHMEFLFFAADENRVIPLDDATVTDFMTIHAESDEWRTWHKDRPEWTKGYAHGTPVFYLQEASGHIRALGLAQMFKLAYRHSVGDMIDHTQPRHRDEEALDLADLIFGTAHSELPTLSLKGRADFSAAVCTTPTPRELPPTAVILNNPKPTFYPNYVVQDAEGGRLKGREYRTYDGPGTEIRGWKRYPARPIDPLTVFPPLEGKQRDNRKVQVRLQPLIEGVEFNGRLRLHNLRPIELGALAWALTWNDSPALRHAIGLGKPLGLGQISIRITAAELRLNRRHQDKTATVTWQECLQAFIAHMEQAYREAQLNSVPSGWLESEQLVQLLAMADPSAAPGQPGDLSHPKLGNGPNEFLEAKKQFQVLPEYAAFAGRRDRDIDWSARDAGAPGSANADRWLTEKLKALSAQHHTPEETLLFGRLVAQAWQQIENDDLKAEVLALIKDRWEQADRWEKPQGKAMKTARAIYQASDA